MLEPPPVPRSPWQRLYGAAHAARRSYWSRRARRLPRPVVSIGNLAWGGTGKTPVTAALARHLVGRGLRIAILSRGYGSAGKGVRLVSRGDGPLLGPRVAGDEPVLLAGLAPGAAVVVCPDRHRAGQHAAERLDPPPDLFLLDDGFSHLPLARDLDLLLFPAADPFAGGRLAPGGRLREPLVASRRAHAALLTGALREDDGRRLAKALRPHGFEGPGFVSRTRLGSPRWIADEAPLAAGTLVVAVAGIARPAGFFAAARAADLRVVEEIAFGDHHGYPTGSLERIRRAVARHGAQAVLGTGKDRVKLQGRLDLPLAELPLRADPEPSFFAWLDDRLDALRTAAQRLKDA
ncbi:MAG: tetraacyldisaccharide 4'-kinase [Acidobacteriota bacterium]